MNNIQYMVEVISYNKIKYRGVILNISPELLQDAHHNNISIEQLHQHIIDIYNKQINIIRNDKLEQLGI